MSIQEVLPEQRSSAIDTMLTELVHGESVWAATDVPRRRELLAQIHHRIGRSAQAWVDVSAGTKGLPADSPLVGEEWLTGPYCVLVGLAALIDSLAALERGDSPVDGFRFGRAPGNRVTVRGLPHTTFDRILQNGTSLDIWMPPGMDEDTVRARAGLGERDPARTQGVGLVLGSGNVTSIPVMDVIYELYANNRVVVLKLNPITDPLLVVFSHVLEPLIELGVLRIVTGGADVGAYLAHHPQVSHVHMTGSAATHDAVVFGTGPDGANRKAENRPLLTKEITSELGGVSPIIVLPGRWSAADLRFQAENVATMRLHNGGYNCVAGQVVIVSSDWAQKDEFVAELRAVLNRAPARPAYYPGSDQRVADAVAACPTAERLGPDGGRVLITSMSSTDRDYLLQTEVFAPVLGVLELPGAGQSFLDRAVSTVNDEVMGTLNVHLIAHPRTVAELDGFEDAIARLRYGCVAVNVYAGVSTMAAVASWGAFAGHTLDDIQSGIGVVHNALLLENPERTVVRGPFRPSPRSLLHGERTIAPRPPWFVTNRTAAGTGRALAEFAARPGWAKLPKVLASAVRG